MAAIIPPVISQLRATSNASPIQAVSVDTDGRPAGATATTQKKVITMYDPSLYTDKEGNVFRRVARDKNNNVLQLSLEDWARLDKIMPKIADLKDAQVNALFNKTLVAATGTDAEKEEEAVQKADELRGSDMTLDLARNELYFSQGSEGKTQKPISFKEANDDVDANQVEAFADLKQEFLNRPFKGSKISVSSRPKGDSTHERLDPTPKGSHPYKLDDEDYAICIHALEKSAKPQRPFQALPLTHISEAENAWNTLVEQVEEACESADQKPTMKNRVFLLPLITDDGDHITVLIDAGTRECHLFCNSLVRDDAAKVVNFTRHLRDLWLQELTNALFDDHNPCIQLYQHVAVDTPASRPDNQTPFAEWDLSNPIQRLAIIDYFASNKLKGKLLNDADDRAYQTRLCNEISRHNPPESRDNENPYHTFPTTRQRFIKLTSNG